MRQHANPYNENKIMTSGISKLINAAFSSQAIVSKQLTNSMNFLRSLSCRSAQTCQKTCSTLKMVNKCLKMRKNSLYLMQAMTNSLSKQLKIPTQVQKQNRRSIPQNSSPLLQKMKDRPRFISKLHFLIVCGSI